VSAAVAHVHEPNGAVASVHASVHVLPPDGRDWTVQEAIPDPPSVAVPVSATFPWSGVPGFVSVGTAGAVLSTRTLVTTADVVLSPAPSAAVARSSYRPSVSVVVLTEHWYGAVVSAHSCDHDPPAGRIWSVTLATPVPVPSAAVAAIVAVPRSGPGATTETVGAVLSAVRVSRSSRTFPAASVARARSSYEPSVSVVVASAHERGDVAPEHSVVHEPPAGR
jgi:hypothetical protein